MNGEIQKVLNALNADRAMANTIVIFTSDHEELLGAHGGMFQKWHQAYALMTATYPARHPARPRATPTWMA